MFRNLFDALNCLSINSLVFFFSLAAALLPEGSTATVGFGGYVGGSRLDSSLASDDAISFVVMFPSKFLLLFSFCSLL